MSVLTVAYPTLYKECKGWQPEIGRVTCRTLYHGGFIEYPKEWLNALHDMTPLRVVLQAVRYRLAHRPGRCRLLAGALSASF